MHDSAALLDVLLSDLGELEKFITSDLSLAEARRVSMANSFVKKWLPCDSAMGDRVALDKFIACNDACRDYTFIPTRLFHDELLGEVRNYLDLVCFRGPETLLSLTSISAGFGVGPGASVGARDNTFYTKLFNSSLTGTSSQLLLMYKEAVSYHATWHQAESIRETLFGSETVAGSKLSFVPKTSEVSRTICTEPVLNMLFQKGIGSVLEKTLKRVFSIDLSSQPEINRRLARTGSVDGSYGTIDLQSASDSISCELIRLICPPLLQRWLNVSRSPVTLLPSGETVKLEMISSMGNAFTFPLQTYIFASLVSAAYRLKGIRPIGGRHKHANFGVFGDDIVVRKDCYEFVCDALKLFGFTVNEGKSFNSGNFRESCGGDYFKGHDVRGVYLKELSHVTDVYSAVNRINRWSSRTGVLLPRTVEKLVRSVPSYLRLYVPPCFSADSGFWAPRDVAERGNLLAGRAAKLAQTRAFTSRQPIRLRWLFTDRTVFVERRGPILSVLSRIAKMGRVGGSAILGRSLDSVYSAETKDTSGESYNRGVRSNAAGCYFCYIRPSPRVLAYPLAVDERPRRDPGFRYNGPGLLLGLLGGYIRDGRTSLREDGVKRAQVAVGRIGFWPTRHGAELLRVHDSTGVSYRLLPGAALDLDDNWEVVVGLHLNLMLELEL